MARNYLREASSILYHNKVNLEDLAETEPIEVLKNLLIAVNLKRPPMIRKSAIYALGQMGYPEMLNSIRQRYSVETAMGVKEAMLASMTAIKLAPIESGKTQDDRCKIIEDVYNGRSMADWQ